MPNNALGIELPPEEWDKPEAAPQIGPGAAMFGNYLAHAPGWDYFDFLPAATNRETGGWDWAMPDVVRSMLRGAIDLGDAPSTGTITPDAQGLLVNNALGKLAMRPDGRLLSAVGDPGEAPRRISATPSFGYDPREHALSSVDILYGDHPTLPAQSRSVEDIGKELMLRGQSALKQLRVKGGVIEGPDPGTDAMLSRVLAHEVKAALDNTPGNAEDWYSGKVEQAMRVATLMHPELASDPAARMGYTGALAITSQGETVPRNARLADDAYRVFQETGRFPTNLSVKKASINDNFAKLNTMLDTMSPEDLQRFLHTQFTAGDLKKMGYPISGETNDTPVYGSTILGPKIGGGFYQNLNGNYDPVTMDLWFMRGWGRLTGSLVGQQDPVAFERIRSRFENALGNTWQKVPRTLPALDRRAEDIVAQHESDFSNFRDDFNAGDRVKSELALAAERWQAARTGLNEVPTSGGQRNWMRSVVNRARGLLEQEGHPMSNADLQALWWYPEKDLYAKLGGRSSESINVDYAKALSDVAREKGIPEGSIQGALGAVD